ncbi:MULTISPECIES: antifreeze protein [unclassified Salipiger]|uniref:antifreeze protein n=1 Tax=unclassified Salipiger TaxID=2640570 RepID=UPI0013BA010A|nr:MULTISPECIES: antifreeze protein [unclassified Salipiger]NDV48320.1 antifreeze protein [Salipiger sp. PrR003]NDW35548.1 antifreeze protein [Salipiger sp. PrR007]
MFEAFTALTGSMMRLGFLGAEAQSVMTYRMLGFAGMWSVPSTEVYRMTAEKGPAFIQAWSQASAAMMRGAPAPVVINAFSRPLEVKARRNRKRLSRRGPQFRPGQRSGW